MLKHNTQKNMIFNFPEAMWLLGPKQVLQQGSISGQMLPNATLETFVYNNFFILAFLALRAQKSELILSHYFIFNKLKVQGNSKCS